VYDLLGYEPQEVIGRTPFDLMPPEEAERVAANSGARVRRNAPLSGLENINLAQDGHQVVSKRTGSLFSMLRGRSKGYRGIDRDITERKQAEQKVRSSCKSSGPFSIPALSAAPL